MRMGVWSVQQQGARTDSAPIQCNHLRAVFLAVVTIGIVFVSIWSDIIGYSSTLPASPDLDTSRTMNSAYTWGRLLISVLFICAPRFFERNATWLMLVEGVTLLFVTSQMTFAGSYASAMAGIPSIVAAFFGGIGGTLLTTPLFLLLARHASPRQAACCVAASVMGESVVSVALSLWAPPLVQAVVCCAAPLLGCGCHALCLNLASHLGAEESRAYGPAITTAFGTAFLLAELSLAIVAAALLRSLSDMGGWGMRHANYLGISTADQLPVLLGVCLVVAAVSIAFFVVPKRASNQARCLMALLVCMVSLQVITLAGGEGTGAALQAIPTGAQLICRMLQWMIFMECANRIALPPYRTHGIASTLNGFTGLLLALGGAIGVSDTVVAMAFMYAFLAVMVAMTVHLMRQLDEAPGPSPELSPSGEAQAPAHAELQPLLDRYGISSREADVLKLLVQGHPRTQIEEILDLSEGTVRTHMNSIYRKCGVHSRAELVCLAQGEEKSKPEPSPR